MSTPAQAALLIHGVCVPVSRRKNGRPVAGERHTAPVISCAIAPEVRDAIDAVAASTGFSRSDIMRTALETVFGAAA